MKIVLWISGGKCRVELWRGIIKAKKMHKWDFRNTYYLIGVIDRAISLGLLFFMVLWLLKKKNATFATAQIFLRTYLRRILSLYDLLNGDGIGGGNILKKRLLTLCFDYRNFEHSDMLSEHSNDRCHIVC